MHGYCPKCHEVKDLTQHHIWPKRFFRGGYGKLSICRNCHDEIETILPRYVKLSKEDYLWITKIWLLGGNPIVIGGPYGNDASAEMSTPFECLEGLIGIDTTGSA